MSDPFTMVIAIVAIATVGKVMNSKYKAQNGIVESRDMNGNVQQQQIAGADSDVLRSEVKELKERIIVLERIATDNRGADDLNRQIEELRSR